MKRGVVNRAKPHNRERHRIIIVVGVSSSGSTHSAWLAVNDPFFDGSANERMGTIFFRMFLAQLLKGDLSLLKPVRQT